MKKIPLTQGKFAIVDDEDYKWLITHKWLALKCDGIFYAAYSKRIGARSLGKYQWHLMHREILGLTAGDGRIGDHKNRNSLDNRRQNLRVVSASLSSVNTGLRKSNTSGYRGVTFRNRKKNPIWESSITINKKHVYLGCFPTAIDAAKAYDMAAIKNHGNDAMINFQKENNNAF